MLNNDNNQLDLHEYASLVDLFTNACKRFGDKPAFACLGKSHSFNEIDKLSTDFAAFLQHHTQLQPGDKVAIQLPNLTQFVIAAYGVLKAGMVLVNTNPLYTERELIHQFKDSGARVLVVLSDLLPTLAKVVAETPIELVISTHALDLVSPQIQPKTGLKNIDFLKALELGSQENCQPVAANHGTLAALQYTGGTTGLSKGAMLSHGNLIANALQCRDRLAGVITPGEDIFVAPLPIYHIYAFLVNLVLFFEQGACSVLIPNPRDIPALIKTLAKYPFTGFAGLNTLFVALCHQAEFRALDFSHLKLTISGGTALTEAAASLWQQTTGCTISEGYGLSETSPVITLNQPGSERLGTIGRPVLATEVLILNEDETPVPIGQAGELAVRGPQVMSGYWQQADETARVFTKDGFFKTGDIAIAEPDGCYRIVDRKKDMIIVSGFNVYPNEVENVLASHPSVLECAVIGVADERSGEAVKAVIVLKPSENADEAEAAITAHCKANLAGYKQPKHIEFAASLPKSTVGKILRRALRS
ncbi:AMP-binding protein [Shewanella litorisediminis]|uniref:Long-chain-fatty-acid--CoA ligase n=1 Tax=Shewanella litorisediminis TaxID=1173586 RepID=A0ABX7G1G5_9GAMM|nr:AMP-binding protein [Shewanella litorisediminis]MCL2919082.1 AMP-binding protein [Shewanella litorisediminis]QRH01139.1 AMP-binding protein [Shewanella litorisediminis]